MASFDFVDAAVRAYEFTWRERSYITRVTMPVIFVKLACVFMIFVSGLQEEYLLNGLIAMPGHIVEAIFIIGLIRYALYREPIFIWSQELQPPENDQKPLLYSNPASRWRNLQAGFAMYLLIKVILIAMDGTGAMLDSEHTIDSVLQKDPPPPTLISAMLILSMLWLIAIIVWSFRLLWLYIPVTMGYPFTKFLKKINGLNISLSLIAVCFICYMPILILFTVFANIINFFVTDGSILYIIAYSIMDVVRDLTLIFLPAIAVTYGIVEILSRTKPDK